MAPERVRARDAAAVLHRYASCDHTARASPPRARRARQPPIRACRGCSLAIPGAARSARTADCRNDHSRHRPVGCTAGYKAGCRADRTSDPRSAVHTPGWGPGCRTPARGEWGRCSSRPGPHCSSRRASRSRHCIRRPALQRQEEPRPGLRWRAAEDAHTNAQYATCGTPLYVHSANYELVNRPLRSTRRRLISPVFPSVENGGDFNTDGTPGAAG